MLAEYFRIETAKLSEACLSDVRDRADWEAKRAIRRQELLEMLGLDPLPERTDLQATITGTLDQPDFLVERLHFQSRPGLYVTANLYLPREAPRPWPAVLYVCGHGAMKKDGISYGNKVTYHHHGVWFARHGYACLIVDSLQLGEIEGIHHGTYRYGMWWWLNRGYTPAGVEAWNCVRALDYLQSRPEIDPQRLGVTGRSGGGAYSWWIAALDDRIQAAVPVAGITDLQNHVVDGCVEGHCDCMYLVNTYRWDYPLVAALVAPRALLLSNSDRDGIFPLDGVVRTHTLARRIYDLCGASEKLGLVITPGPHQDTQELQVPAFRWFHRYLRDDKTSQIERAAVKILEPEQLRVFTALPADQRNTDAHEWFVPAAQTPAVPADGAQWAAMCDAWRAALTAKCFRAWPEDAGPLELEPAWSIERDGLQLQAFDFTSQPGIRLRLYLLRRAGLEKAERIVLRVLDDQAWSETLAALRPAFAAELAEEAEVAADEAAFRRLAADLAASPRALVHFPPRGVGPTAWDPAEKKQTQVRRRFYLLGQTLEGMQVWDVRRAIQAVRQIAGAGGVPLGLEAHRRMAGAGLYASLFEADLAGLELHDLPRSHRDGPILLNIQRFLDLPQAVAMAAARTPLTVHAQDAGDWEYPQSVAKSLGWDGTRLHVRVERDESSGQRTGEER